MNVARLLPITNVLLEIVINTYFMNSKCIFIILDKSYEYNSRSVRVPTVLINSTGNELDEKLIFRNYGCDGIFILNHKNPDKVLDNFEFLIKRNMERWNTRKYLIMSSKCRCDNEADYISSIFASTSIKYLSDLIVIWATELGEFYNIWTHPYVGNDGTNSVPKVLDRWYPKNSSFLYRRNLYPNKLGNQMGRVVNFGSVTYKPYSILDSSRKKYGGTEVTFAFELSRKLNLTPIIKEADSNNWGNVYDNYTGNGLFGDLVHDEVDISFAAIYTWERYYNFFDYSKVWARSGISLLVPAPKIGIGWLIAFDSFSSNLWILTGFSFILSSSVLVLILTFNVNNQRSLFINFTMAFTTVLRIFTFQPLPKTPENKLFNCVLGLLHLQAVFLIGSYFSGYECVMTVPKYEDYVKTVDDFVDRRLHWVGITDAYLFSIQDIEEEKFKIIKSLFELKTNNELKSIAEMPSTKIGFAFERLPYGYFAIGEFMNKNSITRYTIMEEDIYWSYCMFIARKNSILLPLIDDLLLRVFDSGLVYYWEAKSVQTYMDTSVQRITSLGTHTKNDIKLVALKWEHVKGCFAMLGFGLILSIIAFLVEIRMKRLKPIKTSMTHEIISL